MEVGYDRVVCVQGNAKLLLKIIEPVPEFFRMLQML
jgi:hypothetical protein